MKNWKQQLSKEMSSIAKKGRTKLFKDFTEKQKTEYMRYVRLKKFGFTWDAKNKKAVEPKTNIIKPKTNIKEEKILKKNTDRILKVLTGILISCLKQIMEKVDKKISYKEAENILINIGLYISNKK